ncbi:MAG: hypothetical protein U1F77_00235 [Kiritimatiellia bacterium]
MLRQFAVGAKGRLEFVEPPDAIRGLLVRGVGIAVNPGFFVRDPRIGERLAQADQASAPMAGTLLEQAVFNFQSGDADLVIGGRKTRLASRRGNAVPARHPAIAVSQQDQKKRAASFDFREAYIENPEFAVPLSPGIIRLDACAQVDRLQTAAPGLQAFGNGGKHDIIQFIPLGMHVPKRGGDKQGNGTPCPVRRLVFVCHGIQILTDTRVGWLDSIRDLFPFRPGVNLRPTGFCRPHPVRPSPNAAAMKVRPPIRSA